MSIASRIGTPEERRVPRVRQKRATAIFRMTGPDARALVSKSPCQKRLPPLGLR